MIVLSLLTAVSIIMVGLNILEIVFDRKRLPAEDDVSMSLIHVQALCSCCPVSF